MGKVRHEVDPKFEKIVEAWNKLSDDEQEKLFPHLLNSIIGWRTFSVNPQAQWSWLKNAFKEANVPLHK